MSAGGSLMKIATYSCDNGKNKVSPTNIDDFDDLLKNEVNTFDICALSKLSKQKINNSLNNPKTTRNGNLLCWYQLDGSSKSDITGFLLHSEFVKQYNYQSKQHKVKTNQFSFLDVSKKQGGKIFRIINCCVPEYRRHGNDKFKEFLLDLKTFLIISVEKHDVEPYQILLLGHFNAQVGVTNHFIKPYANLNSLITSKLLTHLKDINESYQSFPDVTRAMSENVFSALRKNLRNSSLINSAHVVGKETYENESDEIERNFRGDMLIAFAYYFQFCVINSWIPNRDKWTHMKQCKRVIDYLLCKSADIISSYVVHDIPEDDNYLLRFSDHRLLLFNVKSGNNEEILRIATYNCQSKGRQLNEKLSEDFFGARIQGGYDIIALTEFSTTLTSEQKTVTLNGKCTLYSFGDENNRGTAFLLSKKFTDKYDHQGRKENSRISSLDILEKETSKVIYRIVNCYAPATNHSACTEEDFKDYLVELKEIVKNAVTTDNISVAKLLVMGDFNAQVGLSKETLSWGLKKMNNHNVKEILRSIANVEEVSKEMSEYVVGPHGHRRPDKSCYRDFYGELLIALASVERFKFRAVNTWLPHDEKWTYNDNDSKKRTVRDYLFCQDIVNVSESYGIFNMKKNDVMFSKHRLLLFKVTAPKAFEVDLTTIFTRNNNANNGFDNLRNKICDLCTELSYFNNNPILKDNFSTKFSEMFCDEVLEEMFKSNCVDYKIWANIVLTNEQSVWQSVRARIYHRPRGRDKRKCTHDWTIKLDANRNNNNEPEP